MEAARHKGWTLHFADLDIDTSTLAGEMAANIIISGSQYERRLISCAPEMPWRPSTPGERGSVRRPHYRWRSPVESSTSGPTSSHSRRSLMG
jgi:hypothetical protein